MTDPTEPLKQLADELSGPGPAIEFLKRIKFEELHTLKVWTEYASKARDNKREIEKRQNNVKYLDMAIDALRLEGELLAICRRVVDAYVNDNKLGKYMSDLNDYLRKASQQECEADGR